MSVSPVHFGKIVKITGGAGEDERREAASRYADAQNEKLGRGKAEHLRDYEETEDGDHFVHDYVVTESSDDTPDEAKNAAELRFRYDRAQGGYGDAFRAKLAGSFAEYMRDFHFLFNKWADGAVEKTVAELQQEVGS